MGSDAREGRKSLPDKTSSGLCGVLRSHQRPTHSLTMNSLTKVNSTSTFPLTPLYTGKRKNVNTEIQWIRVTRKIPCKICSKPDWCGYSSDGKQAICMRVESERVARNGGWIHELENSSVLPIQPLVVARPAVRIDAERIWRGWRTTTPVNKIDQLAESLGLDPMALDLLGCAWSEERRAYAFPMHDGHGGIIGLRLRSVHGDQYSVTGSRAGLFCPAMSAQPLLYVAEGCSDTGALLQLGLFAIGRPSCLGQEEYVTEFIRLNNIRRVVLVGDCDDPGDRGVKKLQASLRVPSVIFFPPAKDCRAALIAGLNARTMESSLKAMIWSRP